MEETRIELMTMKCSLHAKLLIGCNIVSFDGIILTKMFVLCAQIKLHFTLTIGGCIDVTE